MEIMADRVVYEFIKMGLTPARVENAYANRRTNALAVEFGVSRDELSSLAKRWGISSKDAKAAS